MTTQDLINSLVQAHFKTSAFPLVQNLIHVSEEVAIKYKTTPAEIRSATHIFNAKGNAIGALKARIEKARTEIKAFGLPNPEMAGHIYIQRKDIAAVQSTFDDCEAELVNLKRNVIKAWPALIAEATGRKADLAKFIEWPTPEDFVSRYRVELNWLSQPMAVPEGVLAGLSAEVRAKTEAQSKKAVEGMLREAHYGPVRELVSTLTDMVETWDKGKKRVRQEPFDRMKAAAKQLHDLNWLKIPELDQLSDVLDAAGRVDMVNTPKAEREKAFDKVRDAKAKMEKAIANRNNDLGI